MTADAFYRKGGGVADLVKMVETRPLPRREHRDMPEPIWIQRNGHDASGEEFVTIACPECFRTFPQAIDGSANAILDSSCVFCHGWIFYGIVDRRNWNFRDLSCRLRLSLSRAHRLPNSATERGNKWRHASAQRDEPIFLIRVDAQFQLGVNLTSGKLWEGWHSVPLRGVRGNQVETWAWQLAAGWKTITERRQGKYTSGSHRPCTQASSPAVSKIV